MHKVLSDIVRRKRLEIAEAKDRRPLSALIEASRGLNYRSAFRGRLEGASLKPAIIGEIKLASPTHPALGTLDGIAARARAYEQAREQGTAGPVLHPLFQHAHTVAKRVRTETGIAKGHVSVSSVAVDYVRQVFDHFGDKTILVIGAGKMGALTLKHLRELHPQRILVTNRSPEKATAVAQECGGQAIAVPPHS